MNENNEKEKDFVVLTFRVRPEFRDMLDELKEFKHCLSRAEVFRDAIFDYHRKLKPAYLEKSPYMQEKLERMRAEKEKENMTDEEFVYTTWKVPIFNTVSGEKWFAFHTLANFLSWQPISEAKKCAEDEFDLNYHLQEIQKRTIESKLDGYTIQKNLIDKYGIIIPEELLDERLKTPEEENPLNAQEQAERNE